MKRLTRRSDKNLLGGITLDRLLAKHGILIVQWDLEWRFGGACAWCLWLFGSLIQRLRCGAGLVGMHQVLLVSESQHCCDCEVGTVLFKGYK